MTSTTIPIDRSDEDAVSNILKWVLLLVAIAHLRRPRLGDLGNLPRRAAAAGSVRHRRRAVLMTNADIVAGKAGFQRADLMDYGSLYGMGSYFGEDYTASNLVAPGDPDPGQYRHCQFGKPYAALRPEQQWLAHTAMQAQLQGVDLTARQALVSPAIAAAITTLRGQISAQLLHDDFAKGWTHASSLDAASAMQTADFLIYSSLTTVARRPGSHTSWTQNWPFEPMVGNAPSTSTFLWTWASIGFTFLAMGMVLFIYERWLNDPDNAPMDPVLAKFRPLTSSQRKTGKYFLVVAAVFLLQILVGAIMAHYYSERADFYGLPVDKYLPFNFLRDVHTQTPIVWIGLSWIAAALFLAPAISGQEAKWQGLLVDVLFYVTLAVVVGALAGDYFGVMGYIGKGWFWFGNQGLSYIQLGRFWQIGFFSGLIIWSVLVFRALWPTRATLWRRRRASSGPGDIRLENLLWASTINIALLYAFGMIPLTGIEKSFTITDFWRWWVVHLWVEQSFEFFAAAMSAYLLMAIGLVSRKLAERAVYFELILIFLGGVLGTGHHLYWAGGPDLWVPLGSIFSFIEVLPLVLLILEAIRQHHMIKGQPELQIRPRLPLHHRRGVLEFRRRRRVRRRGAERAAGELLRARHLPDPEPRPHRLVRRLRAAGSRVDLFLPALHGRRDGAVRRSARALGLLALQWRSGAVDRVQFFPDRLGAAGRGLQPRLRLCPQRGVL